MRKKKIAVIGLGDFGKKLVLCLYEEGHEVLVVDKDMDLIDGIKDSCTRAIRMDATDEIGMRSLGLEDFDYVVLAVADDFETLIITSDILKKIGVKEIIARYQSELQVRILKMLGITHVFNPEERAAKNMAEMFRHSHLKQSFVISESAEGDSFRIAEIVVPEFFVGKTLAEVKLKETHHLLLITIKRFKQHPKFKRKEDSQILETLGIPPNNFIFRNNDIMVVFGHNDAIENFLDNI